MSGTKTGGKLAAQTNKELFGDDWYAKIGKIGGSKGAKDGAIKGFASMRANGQTQKIREAGRRGGLKSRRGPAQKTKILVKEPFYVGPFTPHKVDVRLDTLKAGRGYLHPKDEGKSLLSRLLGRGR